jgi:uncharacterized protein
MAIHPEYPLPDVEDPVMRPFWEGARAEKLMLQRERGTGFMHWPPKPMYWKGGGRLEWFEASGHGTIYSWVVGYEPFLPAFRHLLPLVMVLVEVDEGPRLVGYMVDTRPEEMGFGLPVQVVFERLTERVTLPVWKPRR